MCNRGRAGLRSLCRDASRRGRGGLACPAGRGRRIRDRCHRDRRARHDVVIEADPLRQRRRRWNRRQSRVDEGLASGGGSLHGRPESPPGGRIGPSRPAPHGRHRRGLECRAARRHPIAAGSRETLGQGGNGPCHGGIRVKLAGASPDGTAPFRAIELAGLLPPALAHGDVALRAQTGASVEAIGLSIKRGP